MSFYDYHLRNVKICHTFLIVIFFIFIIINFMTKFELDEYQKEAVITNGNILLIAGAGAGKTFTITKKVEYLISQNICLPEEILIISFTNKSINDLKKKINYNCSILTFHKLAIQILKDYNQEFNLVSDNYLYYVTNEFFYSLIDVDLIKELLLYFKEYNYQKFLNSFKYKEFSKVIVNIIKIYKTNGCTKDDIKRIYKSNSFLGKYMYIIKNIYEQDLLANNSYDFDDLIIKATKILNNKYRYKYIIVDEFQDTSQIRFNLINKLRILNDAHLFVVGDDYQSIYHFSGCNLNLFLDFAKLVPNSKILKLKYTYRNSQELINISANFIMKNTKQIKKDLISNKHIVKPIEFIYYLNPKKAFNKLYQNIKKINSDLLVLGRNNKDIIKFSDNKKINYLTVHSSKGLEAENVILINLVDDTYGFPNQIKNHKIIEELHPSDKEILFAEERRLFYVALTRTKNKVYILVPLFRKSCFIKELKKMIK